MIGTGKRDRGKRGEERASFYLEKKGYTVLGKNIRAGKREIDLLVRKGSVLAVVEVRCKTRWSPLFDSEVVNLKKRRHVIQAAREIVGPYREKGDFIRFDVVIVTIDEKENVLSLRHVENAFSATGEIV